MKISQCTPLFQVIYRLRSGAPLSRSASALCFPPPPPPSAPANNTHANITAGAVIHSHAICCVLASQFLAQDSVFRCSELEMIKGISGHSYTDTLMVPCADDVICHAASHIQISRYLSSRTLHRNVTLLIRWRQALLPSFGFVSRRIVQAAVRAHPRTYAVIVKNHGVYIWGSSWQQAKQHAEVYHYLFDLCLQMRAHSSISTRSQ